MIQLTRFDRSTFYLNPHLIETLEQTPDTMIAYGGKKIVVRDTIEEVIARIVAYRRAIGIGFSDVELSVKTEEEQKDRDNED